MSKRTKYLASCDFHTLINNLQIFFNKVDFSPQYILHIHQNLSFQFLKIIKARFQLIQKIISCNHKDGYNNYHYQNLQFILKMTNSQYSKGLKPQQRIQKLSSYPSVFHEDAKQQKIQAIVSEKVQKQFRGLTDSENAMVNSALNKDRIMKADIQDFNADVKVVKDDLKDLLAFAKRLQIGLKDFKTDICNLEERVEELNEKLITHKESRQKIERQKWKQIKKTLQGMSRALRHP